MNSSFRSSLPTPLLNCDVIIALRCLTISPFADRLLELDEDDPTDAASSIFTRASRRGIVSDDPRVDRLDVDLFSSRELL